MSTKRVPVLIPTEATLAFTADNGWHLLPKPPAWWVDQHLADHADEPADEPIPYRLVDPELDAPVPFWPVDELTSRCGHHCGLDGRDADTDGHCACPECHGRLDAGREQLLEVVSR